MLKITQVKSAIGRKQDHKDTLRALGISRMGQTVYQDDNPVIQGMIRKVVYMLAVSEVDVKSED
jgi:ribosomal protein L30, bacterial/organelle